jgi:uncharacterized membrane protein
MSVYEILKFVHVLSATFLFGTGVGTAFFMWMAHKSKDINALRTTTRHVILADWVFTTPAAIIQPVTGWLLMRELGWSFESRWFLAVVLLYVLVGICWVPVVVIQYRLRRFADSVAAFSELPVEYHASMRSWTALGVLAFFAMFGLFALMIFKPLGAGVA